MPARNNHGFSIILLILLLFILGALGAGGWFGWQIYSRSIQPRTQLAVAKVKPGLMDFAHSQLPNTYALITSLDDTIVLVKGEIDRLTGIAKQYPAQKELLGKEIEKLGTAKTELDQALTATLGDTETLYITYLIDPAKGLREIKRQRTIIRRQGRDALHRHAALRQRLSRNQPSQGLLDRLLALVGK
jgi:hypothetical protein